ncbi:hypothetical protein GGQ68_000830 [Sagittula marina]|uniref:Uncharacterized protein n=1 Tax=Sagittula marina TaxID=943940 RepID=A0A7W6GSW0_9RHOB|nr:hypothetical protein [Sagittula marina]MBB3984514.1 hypothetical protein [Sagittula marina]
MITTIAAALIRAPVLFFILDGLSWIPTEVRTDAGCLDIWVKGASAAPVPTGSKAASVRSADVAPQHVTICQSWVAHSQARTGNRDRIKQPGGAQQWAAGVERGLGPLGADR